MRHSASPAGTRRSSGRRAVVGVVVGVTAIASLTLGMSATGTSDAATDLQDASVAALPPVTASAPGAEVDGRRLRPPRTTPTTAAPTTAAPTTAAPTTAAPTTAAPTTAAPTTAAPTTAALRPVVPTTPAPTRGATEPGPTSSAAAPAVPAPTAGTWLSGAAGAGVTTGEFAAWRGSPVTISSTWADNNTAQTELWQLQPGGAFASWDQPLDVAIGAISDQETWKAAAAGAYDARWRTSLTNMRNFWGERPGTLYIRFAHEMNSNWYPWSVDASEAADFVASWKRFRALQQEVFPASELVFNVNRESVGNGIDWRKTFPGAQYVDVMSVDYYNQYPYVATAADWQASLRATDQYGAPKGLQTHLDFARSVGLPLAVSEWNGKAREGDSPAFISGMRDFFAANAGAGAGQLLYEVLFNIEMNDGDYILYGATKMPASAARYRDDF